MTGWRVTRFDISTSAATEKSDVLFANGRMQVPVNVQIRACLAENEDSTYTLSENELAPIRLIDYFTHAELATQGAAGWVWSRQKTQFAGSLHSAGNVDWQPDAQSQLVQFYVSTTISEKKSIGASIRQSDGNIIRTSENSYNHSIVLKAQPAFSYTYPENVGLEHQRVTDGHYPIHLEGTSGFNCRWGQMNYYLTTKDYPLLYSSDDCSGFYPPPHYADSYSDRHLESCYAGHVGDGEKSLSLFFLWNNPLGTTASQRRIGLTSDLKLLCYPMPGHYTADAYADITVNDKKNSVCFSYVNFHDVPSSTAGKMRPITWWYATHLTVYDIHGNRGTFRVSDSEAKDAVVIYNDN